jgi:putative integral membrane protein (TIGR02587 family)
MPGQNSAYLRKNIGSAFGGALIFALPLLMTMEMWWLGFYLDRLRMALFVLTLLPVLVGLSYYSGFRRTFNLKEDLIDALVAFAVGMVMSAVFLGLLGVLWVGMSADALLGKIILLAVPASIGAILAAKQLGEAEGGNERALRQASYPGELFVMAAGAMLLAFNVAPTEEMILISYKMTVWHALLLALLTIAIMHPIIRTVGFKQEERRPEGATNWRLFYHFTIVGYAISLLTSLYMLWIFGRLDGSGLAMAVRATVVMAFPAGVGAAVSRLVV